MFVLGFGQRKVGLVPSPKIPDGQLWDASLSYGLHPCIKPTAKYKGKESCNVFIYHYQSLDLLSYSSSLYQCQKQKHTLAVSGSVLLELRNRNILPEVCLFLFLFFFLHKNVEQFGSALISTLIDLYVYIDMYLYVLAHACSFSSPKVYTVSVLTSGSRVKRQLP